MNARPIQDILLVKPDIETHKLFVMLRQKQTGAGVVVAAGPDSKDVKEGMKVLFGDNIGQSLTWNGEELLAMRESHLLGVFE